MRQKPNNLCNNLHRFSYTKSVKCVYSFQFYKLVHNLYECIVSPYTLESFQTPRHSTFFHSLLLHSMWYSRRIHEHISYGGSFTCGENVCLHASGWFTNIIKKKLNL